MRRLVGMCFVVALMVFLGNAANAATWNVPGDFATIQEAIDSTMVMPGASILVGPGNHAGALVTKSVEIKGEGGAVINDGPGHGSGMSQGFRLMPGSDGATISHLGFEVDLAIMNGAKVSDVTIDHCTFANTVQAISNWGGTGWQISHNVITDLRTRNGGGIGILLADWTGGTTVTDNVVSHNKITGVLHVSPSDGGGYSGTGIVMYADFRWGWAGGTITNNRVVKNNVSMFSDTPEVVDILAFELTDTRGEDAVAPYAVHDNAVGFNDWRGTTLQMAFTPLQIESENSVSRNHGENRGHGLHPSVFGPGGN